MSSSVALENVWNFWTSNMRCDPEVKFVSQFNSIQVFWERFQAQPVSQLPDKTYLHVFKDNIKPLWEDPANFCGGHFKLTAKSQSQSENMWVTVLLNMLGEQFPGSELVNGASVMSNQVGNNLVKVWLASTDKTKVQAVRVFLRTILNAADYMPNVTFVPHKLVVKGAGKKLSNRITDASPQLLAAAPAFETSSVDGIATGEISAFVVDILPPCEALATSPYQNLRRRARADLCLNAPVGASQMRPYPSPRSPESTVSFGFGSFGGALSTVPSSQCSEYSSMPPSPRPISPAASYTGSEWEADCVVGRRFPPSPAEACNSGRRWSVASQDLTYTHNPYSLANSVIYSLA